MPGDNVEMGVELIVPVAIEDGLRFAIREGGRTVGSGSSSRSRRKSSARNVECGTLLPHSTFRETHLAGVEHGKAKVRIRLKAYDHKISDQSARQIVEAAERTGALVAGPVPLPTKIEKYSVIRSSFIDKDLARAV